MRSAFLAGAESAGDSIFLQDIVDAKGLGFSDRSIDIDKSIIRLAISSAIKMAEDNLISEYPGLIDVVPFEYEHWSQVELRCLHEVHRHQQCSTLEADFLGLDTSRYSGTTFPRCNTMYSIMDMKASGRSFACALMAPLVTQGFGISLYCNFYNITPKKNGFQSPSP